MKSIVFAISLLLSFPSFAKKEKKEKKDCTYNISEDYVQVKWEAFKTPLKVGVGGKLKNLKISSEKQGKAIIDIVRAAKMEIDTKSVDTNDKGRDLKISKFFFSTMEGGEKITVETKDIDKDKITMAITMNGKTIDVPLRYNEHRGNFKAEGVIDVLDFAMNDELAALNKACSQKHEGKTWSDVNIEISARFRKICK